ncbi:unnamed protein product [Larinioides sclopetarius]|uniref:Uncharacterized protein n=1 Tax=Larinioides sclopetarius TaxID=280406 RepID=A0AAV2AZG4_9ARAC
MKWIWLHGITSLLKQNVLIKFVDIVKKKTGLKPDVRPIDRYSSYFNYRRDVNAIILVQCKLHTGRRRHRVLASVIGQLIDDVTVKDASQSEEDSSASRLILSCCTPLDSRRFLAVAGIRRISFSFISEVIWKD